MYRRKVARTAILVDTVQILMGVVACVLPAVTTRAELSDEGLMLILAAFAMLNVVANVWLSYFVATTEACVRGELREGVRRGLPHAKSTLRRLSNADERDTSTFHLQEALLDGAAGMRADTGAGVGSGGGGGGGGGDVEDGQSSAHSSVDVDDSGGVPPGTSGSDGSNGSGRGRGDDDSHGAQGTDAHTEEEEEEEEGPEPCWGTGSFLQKPELQVEWNEAGVGSRQKKEERHISWSEVRAESSGACVGVGVGVWSCVCGVCGCGCCADGLRYDWRTSPSHGDMAQLFFDLIYVAAIARLGEDLRGDGDATPLRLSAYIVTFASLYSTWVHITQYATVRRMPVHALPCAVHHGTTPDVALCPQRWFNDDTFSKLWLASLMVGVTMLCTRVRARCNSRTVASPCTPMAHDGVHDVCRHGQGGLLGPNFPTYAVTAAAIRLVVTFPYFSIAYHVPKYRAAAFVDIGRLIVEATLIGVSPWVPAPGGDTVRVNALFSVLRRVRRLTWLLSHCHADGPPVRDGPGCVWAVDLYVVARVYGVTAAQHCTALTRVVLQSLASSLSESRVESDWPHGSRCVFVWGAVLCG